MIRKITRAALGVTMGTLISGSAMAAQEVIWWDFLSGGDGVRMKALISQFNEEHPEIQISGTTLEWGFPSIPRFALPLPSGKDRM